MYSDQVAGYPAAVWDGSSDDRADVTVDRGPSTNDWEQSVVELIATQTVLDGLRFNSMANASGGTLAPGAPVYSKADGSGFAAADANGSAPLPYCIGLLTASAASLAVGVIQKAGHLTLTTAQWDAIAGTTGGLVANKEYYLSGTAGVITSTVPATTGDTILSIGIAVSTTVLNINLVYRRIMP